MTYNVFGGTLNLAQFNSHSGGVAICYVLPVLWMTSDVLLTDAADHSTIAFGTTLGVDITIDVKQ